MLEIVPQFPSEESPPYEYNDQKPNRGERPVLLQQQLPIDPYSSPLILPTILPQPLTHVSHSLQTIPSVQQILNILCHHFRYIP